MSTNYGRLAYQKVEDISKKLNFKEEVDRIMVYAYHNTNIVYGAPMFNHKLIAQEGAVIDCKIEYTLSSASATNVKVVINDVPIHLDDANIFNFKYISGGNDNVEIYFDGVDELTVSTIRFTYAGRLENNLDANMIYFDENQNSFVHMVNGSMVKYTTIDNFISAYKYTTIPKDFLCVNSIITSTKKSGLYAIFYDKELGYIVLRNCANTTKYNLVQVDEPDSALLMPLSSSLYRVVYVKDGKVYFFNTSKYGTNISAITEAKLDNFKIKSVFPIVVVHGHTTNVKSIGAIGEDGVAYILRFDDTISNFVSKKYIGKCDYASGFYDNNSISIVLYNNGIANIMTYSDRLITNLFSKTKYYNCYRLFKLSNGLLGLNFEGVSILA